MKNKSALVLAVAIALIGMVVTPEATAGEPGIAAQVRISFGAGKPRASLGLGAMKRPSAQPHSLRPMIYRPMVQVNLLPSGPRLYANEEKGSGGNRVALIVAGAAVGVLVFAYIVTDDVTDAIVDAIDEA